MKKASSKSVSSSSGVYAPAVIGPDATCACALLLFQKCGIARPHLRAYSDHVTRDARERACERIEALARNGLDLVTFWSEAETIVERVVPHCMGACWYTLDPASLLVTSHHNKFMPEL